MTGRPLHIQIGQTRLAAVVGKPAYHSLSPTIHNGWIEALGLDAAYLAFEPEADDFEGLIGELKDGMAGVNVTMPYKERAFAIADEDYCETVQTSANVLRFEDGRVKAFNTDGEGLLKLWAERGWTGGPVVVLGAGGAGSAVVRTLNGHSMRNVRVVNRDRARAERLADINPDHIHPFGWEEIDQALKKAAVILNATSLGMAGQPPLNLSLEAAPVDAIVTDMVYHPLMTPLLARALRRGHPIVDGLDVLIAQARLSFEIFFGCKPPVDVDVRKLCLEELERRAG